MDFVIKQNWQERKILIGSIAVMMTLAAGQVIWLTGLSGAGKTTLAQSCCSYFRNMGIKVEHLDGDRIRQVAPTGFTHNERVIHILSVGQMAAALERQGTTAVVSLISPYRGTRLKVRRMCKRFVEIYVNTPLFECERRDVKGLYRLARAGAIKNFTGIDDPYEPPINTEIEISTQGKSTKESGEELIAKLENILLGVQRP